MDWRFVRMIACGSLLFILSGCWDRSELSDIMIITGFGIDQVGKNNLRLCTQTFVPEISSGGRTSKPGTIVRCEEGSTIADALSRLQLKYSRRLFWGHSSTLVISKQFAQSHGIQEISDFLVRFPEVWYRQKLFVSNVAAESILAYESPLEMSSEILREMAVSRHMLEMDLLQYSKMINNEAHTAVLPIVDLKKERGKSPHKVVEVVGTAVFKKDNWAGELDMELTRGLLWFRNEVREATFTIHPEKGNKELSLLILQANGELKPSIEGGKWKMTIKVVSEDDIAQNETSLDTSDPAVIERLERESEYVLRTRLKETVARVQSELNTDVLGYADVFYNKYPQIWKKTRDNWGSQFRQVETEYDVHVNIARPGEYVPPLTGVKNGGK
jgi:spore germination protein KC